MPIFNNLYQDLWSAKHNITDTFKIAFCANGNAPDETTETTYADLTGAGKIVALTNLTSGHDTLANVTTTPSGSTTPLDHDDRLVEMDSGTIDVRYLVIYNDTHVNKPLICYFDMTGTSSNITIGTSGSGLTYRPNASGVVSFSHA